VAAAIFGALLGVFTSLFIENTGLYTGGTGAFFQGIARVVQTSIRKGDSMSDAELHLLYNSLF
jgi:hypothetical protein